MKKGIFIVFILLLLVAFVGCSNNEGQEQGENGDTPKEAKETLVVGTSPDFPPFENIDENGEIVGFDIDLINEIAKEMDREVELKSMDFNGIVTAVQTGKIDLGISGLTANDERKEKVGFSEPYYYASQALLVKEEDKSIESMDALKGEVVGSQLGSTSDDVIMEFKEIEAKQYNKVTDAVLDLKNGRIKAVIVEDSIAKAFDEKNEDVSMIVPENLNEEEEPFAIAVPKEEEELLKEINEALASIRESGKYDELFEKWFSEK